MRLKRLVVKLEFCGQRLQVEAVGFGGLVAVIDTLGNHVDETSKKRQILSRSRDGHAASFANNPDRPARSSRFLTDDGDHLLPPRGVRSWSRSSCPAISRSVRSGFDEWMPATSVIRRSSGRRGGDLRSRAGSARRSATIHFAARRRRSGVQSMPRCFRTRSMLLASVLEFRDCLEAGLLPWRRGYRLWSVPKSALVRAGRRR